MPNYQIYCGVHLDHHVEPWGYMSFHKILMLEYPDQNLTCTTLTEACGSVNHDFLYPLLVQSKYFLDGICDGHVTFKCGAAAKTATGYIVSLNKLSNIGTITNLGNMAYTFSPTYNFTANAYLTVPVYMPLDKQAVNENEKLFLRINLVTAETSGINLSHANDSSVPDIKIRIPYAPTG
jgi:hypothetical protein